MAILFDWDSWWGSELDSHPTEKLRYRREAVEWWTALLNAGIRADVLPADADLSGYRMVIAPVLYAVPEELRARLDAYVRAGGSLVATYFSGVVNEDDRVWLGGYPGAFRELLGVRVEEFRPLWEGETVGLSIGARGSLWSEPVDVVADDVEVLASYTDGDLDGGAAVTWRPVGEGAAAYVSTRLGVDGLGALLPLLLERAGVESELPEPLRGAVELAVRRAGEHRVRFLINRTDDEVRLDGIEGEYLVGGPVLAPRGVAVVR